MCEWSNWRFICEGRYDILLAVLACAALSGALTLILISYFGARYQARHPHGRAILAARSAFLHGGGMKSLIGDRASASDAAKKK